LKLTNREKVLLSILAVLLIVFALYKYIINPVIEKYEVSKTIYEKKLNELNEIEKNIIRKEDMQLLIENFKNKVSVLEEALPPVIHQEEIVIYLDKLINENKLKLTTVSFADESTGFKSTNEEPIDSILEEYSKLVASTNINANINKYKNGDQEEEKDQKKYSEFTVNLSISGSYSDIKSFLNEIERNPKKIVISNIAISKDLTKLDYLVGSVNLSFPYFYDNEILRAINWPYNGEYGNDNPFKYKISNVINNVNSNTVSNTNTTNNTVSNNTTSAEPNTPVVEEKTVETYYEQSDFFINLKPNTSDLPTVTIGKSPFRYTSLYRDNDGIENIYIKIKMVDGKYYYKYGNSLQSYPSGDGYDLLEPFNIKDKEVIVEVSSQPRLPSNDTMGSMLTITNDSDLKVSVHVFNDDLVKPRIVIYSESGEYKLYTHN